MLKLFSTLVRGAVAEAEEAAFDQHATRVLAQQLRDAATALEFAKKELALAMAHRASEARAAEMLSARIATLEQSAVQALGASRRDLAGEAATVIAATEDERSDRLDAIVRFDADIVRLQKSSEEGNRRLRELRRGLEMARAQEALNRAGANGRRALAGGTGALREAETTLALIRSSLAFNDDEIAALEELEKRNSGAELDARLTAAGFGPAAKTKPADVLARIKASAAAATGQAAQDSQSCPTLG
jgi:phage shock protein A